MRPKLFVIAAALLLAVPAGTTLAQTTHRKVAIILKGQPKGSKDLRDKDTEDESFDQKDMDANAALMKTALEAHDYKEVHVTDSWTVGPGSFTSIIDNLSTGPHPLTSADEVVIYITAHGKQEPFEGSLKNGTNDIQVQDLTDRDGHAIDANNPPPFIYNGSIEIGGTGSARGNLPSVTGTMLRLEVQKLPDKHTGVVIDTCHAGMNIVPLSQISGVEVIKTSSRADENSCFGAVGSTIPIPLSDGTQILIPRTEEPKGGSAFSHAFYLGMQNAPHDASVAVLLQAGQDYALEHDPTAVAGTREPASQIPLSPTPTGPEKDIHKYKEHPQEYNRPDPQIALTNAQNAFRDAQEKAQDTAKAMNDAAIALDAAKAANPQGGQAVNDAQSALDKAIADDAAAAGAERSAKQTLDAKKKAVDELSYNAPPAKEPHIGQTSEETNHESLASTNPSFLESENGGHPSVAATTKAGEFNGQGAVAALGSVHTPSTSTLVSNPAVKDTTTSLTTQARTVVSEPSLTPSAVTPSGSSPNESKTVSVGTPNTTTLPSNAAVQETTSLNTQSVRATVAKPYLAPSTAASPGSSSKEKAVHSSWPGAGIKRNTRIR